MKPIIKIVLIVAAVALIAGVCYTVWDILSKSAVQSKTEDITEWEIYRNEEHGFEIKYPKEWHGYLFFDTNYYYISTFSKKECEKYFGTFEEEKIGENYGSISIDYPLREKSLEEMFQLTKKVIEGRARMSNAPSKIEGLVTEAITQGNINGYRIYYTERYPAQDYYQEGIEIVYLFPDKNNKGTIRFEGMFKGKNTSEEIYKEHAATFKRIISTFRFLDP